MSGPLAGKVAIVTGGSKGIGAATVAELARQGAKVVINFSSDATPAEELVKQIGPENALAVKADAASLVGVELIVKETIEKFGKIDILIPNAGILPMKDLESTTEADFDKTIAINVKGPYFLAQKAAPHMSEGGHIVFISTSLCAASTVTPNYLLYNTTKGAIEQMTRVMAKDLGRRGISVNAIAPGPTGTELFLRGKPEQLIKTIASGNPYNRLGKPDEIARAIVMLSSGASQWINGQVLRVNGGMA